MSGTRRMRHYMTVGLSCEGHSSQAKRKSWTAPVHILHALSPNDCRALLAYHALGAVNFNDHPDLRPEGEKIAEKCAGLPLAAKTVGGVLRSRYELSEWKAIVESRFEGFHCLRGLRTFLALYSSKCLYNYVADKVIDDVLRHQRILRVLSLYGYQISEVPNCIGSLRHLRYLNLSGSCIKCLPSSMSTLYNLETLILRDCRELVELPSWINKLINLRCLDISETWFLRKMPRGICNLVKLEILPKFIVGGKDGPKLKELKHLQFLREELTVEGLCNVGEVGDATEAALNAKTGLTSLILRWGKDEGPASARDAENQMQILSWLQPHANIKNLEIGGYGGTKLPSWIGGLSFVHLEQVRLCNCRKTEMLPSLGVLPQLKEVEVRRMDAICAVGPEFCGNMVKPFPSLEKLVFVEMHALERWSFSTGSDGENNPFPRLSKLSLEDCPKLMIIEGWPSQFLALVKLVIKECPLLETPLATVALPSLEEGEFRDCDGRMVRGVVSISSSIKCLIMVKIARISELVSFLQGGSLNSLTSLQELWIDRCDELTCMWEEKDGGAVGINRNRALKRLRIEGCHRLVKIGALPPNLEDLHLKDCLNLEELPNDMPSSLRVMRIWECSKVRSLRLPVEGMTTCSLDCDDGSSRSSGSGGNSSATRPPSQLQELSILVCPALMSSDFLNDNAKQLVVPSLKKLEIWGSGVLGPSLEGTTIVGLEEIYITGCEMLKSLTPHFQRSFTRLTKLYLRDCPALELECFPQLPDTLRGLSIRYCPGIKSLPQQMHAHPSLRELEIRSCTGIASFPEEGLPPNLESLTVSNCENLNQPMFKWGLKRTTALRGLRIDGKIGCLVGMNSFPPPPDHGEEDEGQGPGKGGWHVLPHSLTSLRVNYQKSLVTLSSGMQSHLACLQELSIWDCPKLKFLPCEGFPTSLCRLELGGCSEDLVKRCSKGGGGGNYFLFIERIPLVTIFCL
ncbi:hypothetical protein CRG98_016916 [Punica granatum]|uniref:R13L1/DRL21-like LRR repeat region domain-containing protein n=1 Tax=Punica granatum TaxID=22663 RepID=A0A2I0K262_PUNGR|nr:hypothetical protein CRG98_016916 [Punica granatum]